MYIHKTNNIVNHYNKIKHLARLVSLTFIMYITANFALKY